MDWRGFGLVHSNVTLFFTSEPLPRTVSTDDDEIENRGGPAANAEEFSAEGGEFPEDHDVEESESSEHAENSQDEQAEIPAESPQASSPSPSTTTGQPQFFSIGSPVEQGEDTGSESAADDPLEIGETVEPTESERLTRSQARARGVQVPSNLTPPDVPLE